MFQSIPEFKQPKFVEPNPNKEAPQGGGNPEINQEELLSEINDLKSEIAGLKSQKGNLEQTENLTPVQKEKSMGWLGTKLGKISERVASLAKEHQKKLVGISLVGLATTNIGLVISHKSVADKLQFVENRIEFDTKAKKAENKSQDTQMTGWIQEVGRLQNELENMKKDLEARKEQNPQNKNLSQQTPQPALETAPQSENLKIPELKNSITENLKPVVPVNPSILPEPTKLVPASELKNPTPELTKLVEPSVDTPAQAPTTPETNSN